MHIASRNAEWLRLAQNEKLGVGEFFEFIITLIYASIVRSGDAVIDGGASRGRHTFPLAGLVGDSGFVCAIEPISRLADQLQASMPGHVRIFNSALSSFIGNSEFHEVVMLDGQSGLRLRPDLPDFAKTNVETRRVDTLTLDFLLTFLSTRKVRFIKLDLEGGEFAALLGGSEMLSLHEPLVVFEHAQDWSAKLYEYSPKQFFDYFEDRGYVLFDIFGTSFERKDWEAGPRPWYFIAAKRDADLHFINEALPNLIFSLTHILHQFV